MKVEMQLQGLEGVLATLKSLPAEVVSNKGGPVKNALKDGAYVIHAKALENLKKSTAGPLTTGLLVESLIVSRGKAPKSGKGERYLVRVKKKGYAGRSEGKGKKLKGVTTLQTANLLEYGSSTQPAEPWLRPAFQATAQQAIKTTEASLVKRLNAIVKKLAKQNAGKK
jgi:HK97 gp10 family phage protein